MGEPFNPLDIRNLGESLFNEFRVGRCHPLPPTERFRGAGVYALYYKGSFEAYLPIADPDRGIPIYVGKASPPGGRGGAEGLQEVEGNHLYNRLSAHKRSIAAAENLAVRDFLCKYLIVDAVWIPLMESLLIRRHQPLWNSEVNGFGSNTPGQNRSGARSPWDELHPGRPWYARLDQKQTPEQVRERVALHFESHTGADD